MSDRLRELLLKAVRQLDPDEQNEVLGELLAGSAGSMVQPTGHPTGHPTAHPTGHPLTPRTTQLDRSALAERVSALLPESRDLKMLPVRLPAADYERLRTWSREHGFSMAVIVRSLVERFLDGRERAAEAPPPAEAPPAA